MTHLQTFSADIECFKEFRQVEHHNTKVILCFFTYDPIIVSSFLSEFPQAKWSRTHIAWYVPDSTLYRKRLGIAISEIGKKISTSNQVKFVKFRNAQTQKAFSASTLKTYLSEFAQLLLILKLNPVQALTPDRLNAYFVLHKNYQITPTSAKLRHIALFCSLHERLDRSYPILSLKEQPKNYD